MCDKGGRGHASVWLHVQVVPEVYPSTYSKYKKIITFSHIFIKYTSSIKNFECIFAVFEDFHHFFMKYYFS